MHDVQIFNRISDIDVKEWDKLVSPNPMALSGWLKTLEECYQTRAVPLYFVVKNDGSLLGGAVCYFFTSQSNKDSIHSNLFGRGEKIAEILSLTFYPIIECKLLMGSGLPLFARDSLMPSEKEEVFKLLISCIEREAQQQKATFVFAGLLKNDETQKATILRNRRYVNCMNLPVTYMDMQWDSFEQFRKYIRNTRGKNAKNNIAKEMNRAKRHGLEFRSIRNVKGISERLYSLLEMNHKKYNSEPFPFKTNFLEKFLDNLGQQAEIQIVLKNNQIEGIQLELIHDGHSIGPMIGIDHVLSKKDMAYFNLCYYYSIKNAINNKYHRLYCGKALYKTKYRRGFQVGEIVDFYKIPFNLEGFLLRIWLVIHKIWYKRKFYKVLQLNH